jgi:hypothetical protein
MKVLSIKAIVNLEILLQIISFPPGNRLTFFQVLSSKIFDPKIKK